MDPKNTLNKSGAMQQRRMFVTAGRLYTKIPFGFMPSISIIDASMISRVGVDHCREKKLNVYKAFVVLTKAYDVVLHAVKTREETKKLSSV